jgi:probable rRNA maturation factor
VRSVSLPTVAVDVSREGVVVPLSAERVRRIVQTVCKRERVREGLISVTFVTNRAISKMNRDFLGHCGATDIVTFAFQSSGRPSGQSATTIGDIYIAPAVARANARAHGVGVREELTRLLVHGTLHALGYTHPEGDGRTTAPMWRKQEALVAALA